MAGNGRSAYSQRPSKQAVALVPLDPIRDFQDDGASFRVRREAELRRRNAPLIVQGENRLGRWFRRTSPVKIFATIVLGGAAFFFAYFVLAFTCLIIYDAITRG